MILARKMKTLVSLPLRDVRLLAEAWIGLLLARSIIGIVPFRFYEPLLRGRSFQNPISAEVVREVGWAVRCAARNAPFETKCLAQAMAAKAMLSRRHHASVLHLGVKINETRLEAHACLTVGALTVVGGSMEGFGKVASFGAIQEPVEARTAIQSDAA